MKDIGRKIRLLREAKGLTQEQLAHLVGYKSRVSINKIELQRDIPINKVVPIAEALGVDPAELLGWNEPDDKNEDTLEKLIKSYDFEKGAKEHIEMLYEMSPDFRELAYKSIERIYQSYIEVSNIEGGKANEQY